MFHNSLSYLLHMNQQTPGSLLRENHIVYFLPHNTQSRELCEFKGTILTQSHGLRSSMSSPWQTERLCSLGLRRLFKCFLSSLWCIIGCWPLFINLKGADWGLNMSKARMRVCVCVSVDIKKDADMVRGRAHHAAAI